MGKPPNHVTFSDETDQLRPSRRNLSSFPLASSNTQLQRSEDHVPTMQNNTKMNQQFTPIGPEEMT
jgi:hypothetical protein